MAEPEAAALLAVADELYGLGLPEFTPARDARAKALKKDDPDLSTRVKSLRKPSTAAWVVNLLVRREAGQVGQVLDVGTALREAQANLAGEELRALTRQRRQLTAAVTARARAVAADHGQRVTPAVSDQVEATLTAAILDAECARAVRSGMLVTALAATGVDAVDLASAVAVPEALGFTATATARDAEPPPRPELHVVPDPEADRKARAAARERVEEAEAGLASAREVLESAAARVGELEARGLQVQGEIDELRRRLADLEEQAEEVDEELEEAEDARTEAESTVAEATRERDDAAAAEARLQEQTPEG
jgi:hypothetical protein